MELVTIKEAAELLKVSRETIYAAMRCKRLIPFFREGRNCKICKKDLKEYVKTRWNRSVSMYKGKLKYDKSKGEYSVMEAARYLGVPKGYIYTQLRMHRLKYKKKGCSYVLDLQDIKELEKNALDR